ncbi:Protein CHLORORESPIRATORY REDUCTION 42, chloroplastic [Linum perenne]
MAALSFSSSATVSSKSHHSQAFHRPQSRNRTAAVVVRCGAEESPENKIVTSSSPEIKKSKLQIGSPVVFTESPTIIKTAASVPCLLVNSGLVNPGDVGRIVSRKPKDVWAVRLAMGTYLIDGKYFQPLELDD